MGRRRMLGKSGVGPWTPAQLGSNWGLWLDAADSATITQSGGIISAWSDKSGSARDATQSNPTLRPIVGGAINGLDTVNFNGSNQFFSLTSPLPLATSNEFYFFCIVNNDNTGRSSNYGGGIIRQYPGSDAAGSYFFGYNATGLWFNHHLTSGVNASGCIRAVLTLANLSTQMWNYNYDSSLGATSFDRISLAINADQKTKSTFTTSSGWGAGNGEVGRAFSSGGFHFFGRMAELVFVLTSLSTANKERIEGYLAWKWGIEAKLPIGHPYKLSPP